MRYIFAQNDRSFQIQGIKDGIAEYRTDGMADPKRFRMHPVYDEVLAQLADHFLGYWKDSVAVIGVGGYGRKEMSPYSDIDLLFLRPMNAPEGIYRGIRNILYLLWDARVELGHAVRIVRECRMEAHKDLAVLTSLMDARLVWGDKKIFRDLLIERERLILEIEPLDLYLKIEGEIRKSCDMFGHTIYLLEPHLKEGPGSLRYIQCIAWLAKMIFGCSSLDDLSIAGLSSRKSVTEVREAMEFLSEIRARLHFLSGRRDDRLKFDAQSIFAREMGFTDTVGTSGVERFMREYYRHVSTLDFFGRRILARARLFLRPKIASEIKRLKLDQDYYIGAGGIYHEHPESFGQDSKDLLAAFLKVVETGCVLDIRLVDLIRTRLRSVKDPLSDDPEARKLFLDIFRARRPVSRALTAMLKVGFLERFLTEFARVRFLPQHDIYHQYTVDLHTMVVLEEIDAWFKPSHNQDEALLRTIFSRLDKPEVLYLAALFHDIAKGRGPGHEVRGAEIAQTVLQRFGLPAEDVEDVCFLIRNHLAMTHLAFKKDLHDTGLIGRFAENIMDKRRLDLLTLLTYADLRGVGPTAFNSWKNLLLEELYYRTLDAIEGEGLHGEVLVEWIRQIKATVRELVPPEYRDARLDNYLASADSRYFLNFIPSVIADHYVRLRSFLMAHDLDGLRLPDLIASKVDHGKPGYSVITLIVKDRRGLFFRISGTLAANRINILSAWTHSIGDVAVATFHVNDILEGALDDPERWERFCSDFANVMGEKTDVDELVAARRQTRSGFQGQAVPRFPLRVEVDNAASDRATIIEVNAHDRPGLLYDITRRLFALGLNIILTKITTEVDQAADIFYVEDRHGGKIVDFERLEQIKAGLHDHLAAMEAAQFGDKRKEAAV